MPEAVAEGGSYRDPSGRVYRYDGRILRTITDRAAADYERVRENGLLEKLIASGRLIGTAEIDPATVGLAGQGIRYVVEHPPLDMVSYPYEWTFSVLKAAALFHLDLQLELMADGMTLSDASAYNVQFVGAEPVFIDLLSPRPYRQGEYWLGHRQFCEQFLNPLLLEARLGVEFQDWYRGRLEGIPTTELARLIPWRRRLDWRLLTHVILQARLQQRAIAAGGDGKARAAPKALRPYPTSAYLGVLRQLRNWIARLAPEQADPTVWGNYAQTHSYDSAEEQTKRRFVADFAAKTQPRLLWDLGCNTGEYSELALDAGAACVIGFDLDAQALEGAFARARDKRLAFLPLRLDAANPSPDQGWRQRERHGLAGRANADALVALAFEHHLAIGRNVPLPDVVEWLVGLAPRGVVEFVEKSDATIQRMLSRREDIFPDYDAAHFAAALGQAARIVAQETVTEGGRTLYWYDKT